MNKEIKKLLKELKSLGWEVMQARKHFKAKHPKGGFVSFSVSPSCPYALKNIWGDIKRLERQHELVVN